MKLVRLRLKSFRSFGPAATVIDLADMVFLLGPNGSGKTAVLQALARMFSLDPSQRKIRKSDFHVPNDEKDHPLARQLWVEADFEFPELLIDDGTPKPAVPGAFAHMQLEAPSGPAQVRFRLSATLDQDGEVEENFTNVLKTDDNGEPTVETRVAKQDRSSIQVHYLPARRDPADHISYSASALLGRVLRAANWTTEKATVDDLTEKIGSALAGNSAMVSVTQALTKSWEILHTGRHFTSPSVFFGRNEIEALLRHMSVMFTPGHDEASVDFSRLSDGQQSILYLSIVLGVHQLNQRVLRGELKTEFDIDKLRPAVFTLIAVEEPENSLSPHYLGRVVASLTAFSKGQDTQALLATHSASIMHRIDPQDVRYLRLANDRTTRVRTIKLPDKEKDADAFKFVREAVQAFPELYFSRYVILGEGDSEEVVLPRSISAAGTRIDDASISVVPLGGRHVNHFWRLLYGLEIPFVTLLDLDLARHDGGWGRVRYACQQLRAYADVKDTGLTSELIETITHWNAEPRLLDDTNGWLPWLEEQGVFFSYPLDLDFAMMTAFPQAYAVGAEELIEPTQTKIESVLGESHGAVSQYDAAQLSYFGAYHKRFKVGSKPVWHVRAMAELDDEALVASLPSSLKRLTDHAFAALKAIPE
ncbi:AAA family ATPase [Rhizobium laguerreae]|uniref:ATP-dependent nuclease n=1 Tax=Rhizobium laguerreae TaxID=1076926 RepID=UPI00143F5721|nr:AAA family ATPase [Rhizobium laguerreae]NKM88171.1 AAA family ATPase [Rhizobium laguerreae]